MVSTANLKGYKSAGGGLGGGINLADPVPTSAPNNLFTNTSSDKAAAGEDYYLSMFFKNENTTEDMNEFTFWLDSDSPEPDTTYKWAFDPVFGDSLFFDGVDDGIDLADDATLWSQGLTKFSFSFQIYPTANDTGSRRTFHHGATTAHGFNCYLATPTDIVFEIRDSGNVVKESRFTGLPLNQYSRITCVYDSTLVSTNVKLYVGTTLAGTTANLTETITKVATLLFAGSGTRFKGFMKDFMWWTTKALNTTDITNLINGDPDLVTTPDYWLKTLEGTGNPIDFISGTKVGTLTGGTLWNISTQTIPDTFTAPTVDEWFPAGTKPTIPNVGKLAALGSFPVLVWKHVEPGAKSRIDDPCLFAFTFKIPVGGTGTPGGGGGGSGGNPPPTPTNYKIAFAGDWGCESATDDVISLINSQAYDFVWGVGDNSYEGSASCWTSRFSALKTAGKFDSGYGNHEWEESSGIGPYKTFLGHSNTYFTRQVQNIFFLVIDTNINCDPGSAQHNFIKSELERISTDSSVVWKIAIMHHPWFGASSQHSYNDANAVEAFHTLFLTHKVSFVVTGHNHNWQRTHSVAYNSSSPTNPNIVSTTSPFSRSMNGLIHVVAGAGGHDSASSLYSLGSQPSFQAYQNRTHNGVWEIVASNNGNTLTCQFRETGGETFDQFVINA